MGQAWELPLASHASDNVSGKSLRQTDPWRWRSGVLAIAVHTTLVGALWLGASGQEVALPASALPEQTAVPAAPAALTRKQQFSQTGVRPPDAALSRRDAPVATPAASNAAQTAEQTSDFSAETSERQRREIRVRQQAIDDRNLRPKKAAETASRIATEQRESANRRAQFAVAQKTKNQQRLAARIERERLAARTLAVEREKAADDRLKLAVELKKRQLADQEKKRVTLVELKARQRGERETAERERFRQAELQRLASSAGSAS